MLTYILRRLLLIPPTLIGMTAIVFFALAMAPGGIGASLLTTTGEMRPDERKAREEYLNRRYGLDLPKRVQYGHWLNKVSPIGFAVHTDAEPEVAAAIVKQAELRAPIEREVTQLRARRSEASAAPPAGLSPEALKDWMARRDRAVADLTRQIERLEAQRKSIRVAPQPGDIIWSKPLIKPVDLGDSFVRGRPVNDLVAEALPRTMTLQLIALPISYTLAIWLGIQQARRRGSSLDFGASAATLALWAVPQIWVGVLLIGFLANREYLQWFPTTGLNSIGDTAMQFLPHWTESGFKPGWLLDRMYHLVLPVVCIVYAQFAFLSRLTRGALLDNLSADFVRTARAKGLSERVVLYRHAFRNSLIPLITVAAYLLPAMVTGSVVVENIFGINGMGKLAVDGAFQRDFELLLSLTLVAACLQLTGYLLADIGYAIADPRVSYG